MREFFFFAFSIVLISCNAGSAVKPNSAVDFKDIGGRERYESALMEHSKQQNSHSKAFLGLELGASKKQTETIIDSLIRNKKIEPSTTIDFSTINSKTSGYPYMLYLNADTSIKTLIGLDYREDKLASIDILPYGEGSNEERILKFLLDQYGPASFRALGDYQKPTYSSESKDTYCWFKNDYEISYIPTTFGTITYKTLATRLKEIRFKKLIDSLDKDIRKDKAQEAKKDFQ